MGQPVGREPGVRVCMCACMRVYVCGCVPVHVCVCVRARSEGKAGIQLLFLSL